MEQIVVVGGGMAAWRMCRTLSQRGIPPGSTVTILSEERRPAYDRVHLTSLMDGRPPSSLDLAPEGWYGDHGFTLVLGERVQALDRRRGVVIAASGREFPYDRLVLATGSEPLVPAIKGLPHPMVHVYRRVEDIDSIRDAASRASHAVVLGGGLLGLEAARAIRDLGLEVDVLEVNARLLPRQLDARGSERLRNLLSDSGLRLHLRRPVLGVRTVNGRLDLDTDTGNLTPDFMVIAIGIRPRDELARASGLTTGPRGGVLVNDALESSDSRIHAIGECAAWRGQVFGFVTPAYRMADVMAEQLAGSQAAFVPAPFVTRLKLAGIDVAAVGEPPLDDPEVAHESDSGYRRLILMGGTLVGAIGIGEWPDFSRIEEAVRSRRILSLVDRWRFRLVGRLEGSDAAIDVQAWPDRALVCACLGVSKEVLSSALAAGCRTAEALAGRTGASTVCGSCRPLLRRLTGEASAPASGRLRRGLLTTAAITAVLTAILLVLNPPLPSPTVRDWSLADLVRDSRLRQASGYVAAGLAAVSLLLPLRRRWRRFSAGSVALWRTIHGTLGATALASVAFHTSLRLGRNLNAALSSSFIALSLSGALVGAVAGFEERIGGASAIRLRSTLTRIHQAAFWLWPALLALHILAAYYF